MKNFLKFTRGAIPESLVRSVLNRQLKGIAEVLEFELNQDETRARVLVRLEGEETPIALYVDDYVYEREGQEATIRINWIRCDRPWLQNTLERFVVGKTFSIPEERVELADGLLG